MSKSILSIIIFICACGDNIHPPDAGRFRPEGVVVDGVFPSTTGCADFDHIAPGCVDAGVSQPDACPGDDLDDDMRAACCHGLEVGGNIPHECGYPPGLCKTGKYTLLCGDRGFELCRP